jgi:hypothetical protein
MTDVRIDELTTEAAWEDAFPLMMQLWEDAPREFTEKSFPDFIEALRETEGYRLFGLFEDTMLVVVAGVSIRMSAWYGATSGYTTSLRMRHTVRTGTGNSCCRS